MRTLTLLSVFFISLGVGRAAEPTLADARAFMDRAQARLLDLSVDQQRAAWVKDTYITYDTEILAAKADAAVIAATMELAKESTRFDQLKMPDDLAREFKLLRLSLTLAAPSDPKEAQELTQTAARMEGMYGAGKYCPRPGTCLRSRSALRRPAHRHRSQGTAAKPGPAGAPFRRR